MRKNIVILVAIIAVCMVACSNINTAETVESTTVKIQPKEKQKHRLQRLKQQLKSSLQQEQQPQLQQQKVNPQLQKLRPLRELQPQRKLPQPKHIFVIKVVLIIAVQLVQ